MMMAVVTDNVVHRDSRLVSYESITVLVLVEFITPGKSVKNSSYLNQRGVDPTGTKVIINNLACQYFKVTGNMARAVLTFQTHIKDTTFKETTLKNQDTRFNPQVQIRTSRLVLTICPFFFSHFNAVPKRLILTIVTTF
jgi:hypothetical protein